MNSDSFFSMDLNSLLLRAIELSEHDITSLVEEHWDWGENTKGDSFDGIEIWNGGPYDGAHYRSLNITGAMREGLTIDNGELTSTAGHARRVENDIKGHGVDIYSLDPDTELRDKILTQLINLIH